MNRHTNFTSYIKEDDLTKTFLVGNLVRDNINNANMLGNVVLEIGERETKRSAFWQHAKENSGQN